MSGSKKCSSLFGKFGVLCFLVISVLRSAFLPYYRRYLSVYYCLLSTVAYCLHLWLVSWELIHSSFSSFKGSPISLFHIKFSDNIHNQTVNNIRMQRRIQKPVKYLRWNFLRNFLTTSKYSDIWQGFEWLWEMRFCLVTVYLYTEMYWRNEYTGM